MRLHNRQIKAAFWNDPDLLQWRRDMRWFYVGLWQLADDSGCLEDSPFAFKVHLFASPLDEDVTTEVLAGWRDQLVELGKLVPYMAAGKRCLFLVNFHRHQTLDNPTPPNKATIPLPSWLEWCEEFNEDGKRQRYKCRYLIHDELLPCSRLVGDTSETRLPHVGLELGTETITETRNLKPGTRNQGGVGGKVFDRQEAFSWFWAAYPTKKSKGKAEKTWEKIKPDEQLFTAIMAGLERAKRSASWKREGGRFIPYPSTWLNAKGWLDEEGSATGATRHQSGNFPTSSWPGPTPCRPNKCPDQDTSAVHGNEFTDEDLFL